MVASLQQLGQSMNNQQQGTVITETNLVSDGFVSAPTIDPNLINPWGVAFSPTGPFWVSDNGAGVVTIYDGAGTPVPVAGHSAIQVATPGQTTPTTTMSSAGAMGSASTSNQTASATPAAASGTMSTNASGQTTAAFSPAEPVTASVPGTSGPIAPAVMPTSPTALGADMTGAGMSVQAAPMTTMSSTGAMGSASTSNQTASATPAASGTMGSANASGQTTPATPTGAVFNAAGSGFDISSGGVTAPSVFIFATEDGTISGWSPTVNSGSTVLAVDNSDGGNGAVYKGLAIGQTANGPMLYAANFRNGTVDVFNKDFQQVNSFTDPKVPAGFAPFNVQVLDNHLFVTFAKQDSAKHDDVAGPGNGFVDEFDLNGNLQQRVASGGPLDSPWGLAIAPSGFGQFANDLLVGNFGDGTINAYNPTNDQFLGKLLGADGSPITIGDLWSLVPGNGSATSNPQAIYFTAGVQNEAHGLFGTLTATPESNQNQSNTTTSGLSGVSARLNALLGTNVTTAVLSRLRAALSTHSSAMTTATPAVVMPTTPVVPSNTTMSAMPAVLPATSVTQSNTTMPAMLASQPSVMGSSNPLMETTTAMSGALGSSSSPHSMLG